MTFAVLVIVAKDAICRANQYYVILVIRSIIHVLYLGTVWMLLGGCEMNKFMELSREIDNTRFITELPPIERKCLIALHRHEIDQEQYNILKLDCSSRLDMLCCGMY